MESAVSLEKIKASFEALERKAAGREDTLVKKKSPEEVAKAESDSASAVNEMNLKLLALQELFETHKSELEKLKLASLPRQPQEKIAVNMDALVPELCSTRHEDLLKLVSSMRGDLENSKIVIRN